MDITVFIMMLIALLAGIFSGYYLFAVLGGVGFIFGLIFWGPGVFDMLYFRTFSTITDYTLLAIPMFIFMGNMLDRSGVAEKLFDNLSIAFGRLRGGLAVASMVIAILFAATTGIVGASVVTMGLLFLPAMLARNYDKKLATGVICSGGTLGIIIPPSIMLIILGSSAGLSVARLFYAALGPGLMLGFAYIVYVLIHSYINKDYAPPLPEEVISKYSAKAKLLGILVNVIPVLVIIFAVLGTIWFGIAPPTQAAGIGAVASLLIAVIYRKFNFTILKESLLQTLQISSMLYMVVIFAGVFVGVFMRLGGTRVVEQAFLNLPFETWGIFAIMMITIFILGMVMDWVASLLIIVPIFFPIAQALGFEPIWFGIIICVMFQTSFLTPPFAYSIFYLKGIVPPGVEVTHIMKGVVPFVIIQLVVLTICVVFPDIIMWLPELIVGGN